MTKYLLVHQQRHLNSDDCAYIMQDKAKKKFLVSTTKYGTVAYRANVIVEADTEDEASEIAREDAANGLLEVKFDEEGEDLVEGWNYQTEHVEEIIKDDNRTLRRNRNDR